MSQSTASFSCGPVVVSLSSFSVLLLLQIKTYTCAPRRTVSGCSGGPDVTRRNGTKSSVTTAVWGSCWSDAARAAEPTESAGRSETRAHPGAHHPHVPHTGGEAGQQVRRNTPGPVTANHLKDYYIFTVENTFLWPLCLSIRDPADVVTECDLALTSSTVSELAEARRTTYLSGRWIWDDQNGETSISITGAPVTLPSNGDCSTYYSWVEEKSTNQGPGVSPCFKDY